MTLPDKWKIVTYWTADAPPGFEAVAHVYELRKVEGVGVWENLPATAFASKPEVARDLLTAFLSAEIDRETRRIAAAQATSERWAKRRQPA